MFTTVDKAITAFIASVVSILGFASIDISWLGDLTWLPAMLSAAFTAGMTWLIPNKEA